MLASLLAGELVSGVLPCCRAGGPAGQIVRGELASWQAGELACRALKRQGCEGRCMLACLQPTLCDSCPLIVFLLIVCLLC